MTGLAEFVAARLGEDERVALASAGGVHCSEWDRRGDGPLASAVEDGHGDVVVRTEPDDLEPTRVHDVAEHIARHDPARALREVAAKRKILAAYKALAIDFTHVAENAYEFSRREALEMACEALAAVWPDHPDYDQGWAP